MQKSLKIDRQTKSFFNYEIVNKGMNKYKMHEEKEEFISYKVSKQTVKERKKERKKEEKKQASGIASLT